MFPIDHRRRAPQGIQAEIREARQLLWAAKHQFAHASGDGVTVAAYRIKSLESQLDMLYKLAKVQQPA